MLIRKCNHSSLGNEIGNEGAKAIAEALKTNKTLIKLNLGHLKQSTNTLFQPYFSCSFVCKINNIDKNVLAPIKIDMALRGTDEDLKLNNSGVDDSHAQLIADKLMSCKTIKKVYLSGITQETITMQYHIFIINF